MLSHVADAREVLPNTPYFNRISEFVNILNRWRADKTNLMNYIDHQDDIRGYPLEDDGDYPNYCFDNYYELVEAYDSSDSNYECRRIGYHYQGYEAIGEFYDFIDDDKHITERSNVEALPLQWSDELGLSASNYIEYMSGCNVYQPTAYYDEDLEEYLEDLADYDDHFRVVVYPERFDWTHPEEAVFDWLQDDPNYRHRNSRYMLADWFDSIGIACNCHTHFGEQCVIELARNLKPFPRESDFSEFGPQEVDVDCSEIGEAIQQWDNYDG